MLFGQLVVGPPGSGKSTCCKGLQHYFQLTGRSVAVVNLDPANDALPYECAVDVSDLVSQQEVAAQLRLGPNGGVPGAQTCSCSGCRRLTCCTVQACCIAWPSWRPTWIGCRSSCSPCSKVR